MSGINWQAVVDDDDDYYGVSGPANTWGAKPAYDIENMVFIKVSMHQDEATESKAIEFALDKFKNHIDIPTGVRKITVIEAQERILFTSIKIEYTIEFVASKEAALMYYQNTKEKR
jgi:hypothetical protein